MQAEWFEAVAARNMDYISRNLEQCCTLHNEQGLTALMIAAKNGDTELVKKLVPYESGQQDPNGLPAAIYAYNAGHIELMGEILQAEASYRFSDDSDILMYFIKHRCNSVLLGIIHHFPSHIDYNGYSHLDYAVMSRNAYAIELLANSFEYDESSIARALNLAEEVDRSGPTEDLDGSRNPDSLAPVNTSVATNTSIVNVLCKLLHIDPKQIASPEIDDLQYYARGNASVLTDPCVDIASDITGISRLSERNSVAFSDALGLFVQDEFGARASTMLPVPAVPSLEPGNDSISTHSPRVLSSKEQLEAGINAFNQRFPSKGSPGRASAKIQPTNPFGPISIGIYENTMPNRPLSISGLKAMQSDTENSMTEAVMTLDTTMLKKEYSKAIMECERLRREVQRQKLIRLHAVNATVQAVPIRKDAFVQASSAFSSDDSQISAQEAAAIREQDLVRAKITSSTTYDELLSIIAALRKEIEVKNKLLMMNPGPSSFSQPIIDNMVMALQRQTAANKAQRQSMQAKNDQITQLHIALQKRERQVRNLKIVAKANSVTSVEEGNFTVSDREAQLVQPSDATRERDMSVPVSISARESLAGMYPTANDPEFGNSTVTAIHIDANGRPMSATSAAGMPVYVAQGVSTDTYVKLSRENNELTQEVKQLKREIYSLREKLGLHQDPRLVTQDGVGKANLSPLLLLQIENIKLKKQLAEKSKRLQKAEEAV